MTGRAKKILVVIAIMLLCVIGLAACAPQFKGVTGGDPNADTVSNNGFVVKQGEYYYFINGYNTYESIVDGKVNKYGSPIKGAIVRAQKNADGSFTEPEVVVPKIVINNNKEQGFSIFGEYIYYVTPSNAMSREGAIITTDTEFCRSTINGTKNEVIATFTGQDLKYKFTDRGLIVVDKDGALKVVPYTDKTIGKEITVEDATQSIMFSVSNTYKVGVKTAQDYVFYTKASEDIYAKNNELYAVDGEGNKIKLADSTTYGDTKYNLTLKNVAIEASGDVVIYYDKTRAEGSSSVDMGMYGYNLGKSELTAESKINPANEKRFTNRTGMTYTLLTFKDGVMVVDSANAIMYIPTISDSGIETKSISWNLPKGYAPTILKFTNENNRMYMYLQSSARIDRIEMNKLGASSDATGFVTDSFPVIAKDYTSSWFTPEFIDGQIFFMHTTYLNYMYVANIDDATIAKGDGLTSVAVCIRTEADQKAYDKIIEAEKKAEEENK